MVSTWTRTGSLTRSSGSWPHCSKGRSLARASQYPTKEMIVRMLDVIAELSLVAPVEVLTAVNAYTATITSDGYRVQMNDVMATDFAAILSMHQFITRSVRTDAAEAMRRDLLPWWRSKTRDLPLKAQEPHLDELL
jgi:hypothetical protein